MEHAPAWKRLASRAAANLVAVAAISAIFGLKAFIDSHAAVAAEPTDAYASVDVFAANP